MRKEEGADVVMENLFVPGRLCLFGEHSDWAGLNRLYNGKIEKGMAIVSGIEQGIYAEVEKNIDFEVVSELSQGERYYKQKMNVEELRKDAEKGEYFSYMAGTASYMKEHYCIGGGENNTETDGSSNEKGTIFIGCNMCFGGQGF